MKKSELGVIGQTIVSAVLGAIGSMTFLALVDWPTVDVGGSQAIAILLILPAMWLVNVAFHELGHAAAAVAIGRRLMLIAVGPACLSFTNAGWVTGRSRWSWFGGFTVAWPAAQESGRARPLLMVAAGPAATLICGVVSFIALRQLAVSSGGWVAGADAVQFVATAAFAGMAWFLLLVALVPAKAHGQRSDGAALIHVWRNPGENLRQQALMTLATASVNGVRPAEWDDSMVRAALDAPADTHEGAFARLLAHWQAHDRGDAAAARAWLTEALASRSALEGEAEGVLLVAAAMHAAVHDADARAARQWLSEIRSGPTAAMTATYRPSLVEGAVRVSEGRPDALEALAEAERLLPTALEPGFARMDADVLARLKQAASAMGVATAG